MNDAGDGQKDANMVQIRFLRQLIWEQTLLIVEAGFLQNQIETHPMTHQVKGKYRKQKAPPRRCPEVSIEGEDMLIVAQKLVEQGETVAVLNMACAGQPGGGVKHGAGAQEENLHRRTDAFRFTMGQEWCYPIADSVCLVSPGVTVLRGPESEGYKWLEKPYKVTMLSSAALHGPRLNHDREYLCFGERQSMERRIAAIVDGAERSHCTAAVFSAFGCGAFGNPPKEVANMFETAIAGSILKKVVFSIIEDHNSRRWHNPEGNLKPFKNVFST